MFGEEDLSVKEPAPTRRGAGGASVRRDGKTRTSTAGTATHQRSRRGLVTRAIRANKELGPEVEELVQALGEWIFEVDQDEDLKKGSRRRWIRLSAVVADAHRHISKVIQILERGIEEEHRADLDRIAVEIELLEDAHEAAEERRDALLEEQRADRRQARVLRRESHDQRIRRLETRRKVVRAADVVLIVVIAMFALLALGLAVVAVVESEPIFFGGSGGAIGIAALAKLLGHSHEEPPGPEGDGSSLD